MGTSRKKRIAAAAALTAMWPVVALPQAGAGTGGGLQIDIGVKSDLSFDDNFGLDPVSPGNSTILDNLFTFDLSSITGTQEFRLNATGVYRYAEIPGRTASGFEDPNLRLSYKIESANSRLTASGRYRHVDREFLDPFQVEDEEQLVGSLVDNGGTLTVRNAALTYETGINAPLGFTITASHDEKQYAGIDPINVTRLFDTTTDAIDATVSMKVSPVATVRLSSGLKLYDAEDALQTERKTLDYAVGATYEITPVLLLDAKIGRTRVETDTTGGSTDRTGTNGALTLTRTLSNGKIFGSLDSVVNQNGTRTSLRFGRDLQLPLGSLSAAVGATRTPLGDTNLNAAIAFNRSLQSSDFNLTVRRDVSTNAASEDILDTRVSLGYGYEIDSLSRIDVALNWGKTESADAGGTAPTIERTTLRASYSRAVTQDWNLTGGVRLRKRSDSRVAGEADSNSVFLTLDRTFSFRP